MTYLRTSSAAKSRQTAATARDAASEHAEQGADAHIADPLFIIGTGRCGSTVFHDVLAYHPRLTWLSRLTNNYPHKPWVNSSLMRLLSLPGGEAIVRSKISPLEGYPFWEQLYRSFTAPYQDLTADDVMPHSLRALRAASVQRRPPTCWIAARRWRNSSSEDTPRVRWERFIAGRRSRFSRRAINSYDS